MSLGDFFALASALVWSFSVILMRVAGYQIPPMPLTFFKSCVALILLVITLILLKQPFVVDLSGYDYLRLIISGAVGISVADTMIAASLNRLGASLQALADCAYTPTITLVGFLMFGETLNAWEIMGGLLVVSGVFVGAVIKTDVATRKDMIIGIILAASAHAIMGVGILMVRDIYREESVIWVTGFRFFVAVFAMFLYGYIKYPGRLKNKLLLGFYRRDMWRTIIPMAILGPFLATLFWIAGFKFLEAGRAAIYNQMSTAFIIILAYIFLGEKLTTRKALGVFLALTGALLVATH
ncbi:DMT family transporter [Porticoccaceae bacterium]|nr:DMT family transporter [Porticoccaceae bacterium]MDB4077108.1 DMT family transporter [Porticoccaceae bacterium]